MDLFIVFWQLGLNTDSAQNLRTAICELMKNAQRDYTLCRLFALALVVKKTTQNKIVHGWSFTIDTSSEALQSTR